MKSDKYTLDELLALTSEGRGIIDSQKSLLSDKGSDAMCERAYKAFDHAEATKKNNLMMQWVKNGLKMVQKDLNTDRAKNVFQEKAKELQAVAAKIDEGCGPAISTDDGCVFQACIGFDTEGFF